MDKVTPKKTFRAPLCLLLVLLSMLYWQAGFGRSGGFVKEESLSVRPLKYSVVMPVPITLAKAKNTNLLEQALDAIKEAIPSASGVAIIFDHKASNKNDWIALLDVCNKKGFEALVAFAVKVNEGNYQGFRPVKVNDQWQFGPLGSFVKCLECISHPALQAVQTVDEPWHSKKKPAYPTSDLLSMYKSLKMLAPNNKKYKISVQFSRELWRYTTDTPRSDAFWADGISDIVQISALEFQNNMYQHQLLDLNHFWSRGIIHEKTPNKPLWTSVQVMGAKLGPHAGYWFPRENDLRKLLNDLLSDKYQDQHLLTGLMFQQWDSASVARRISQYTLGDMYLPGQPVSQTMASNTAIGVIQDWIANRVARFRL